MISIICPSNRVGGLDLLFASLKAQTHQDFELVLVDALYDERRFLVADAASVSDFTVIHVPPRDNAFPAQQYVRTMNTGIANASGDTLLFLCDYSFLHSDCLATHALIQATHPGPVILDYRYVDLPPLKPGLPNYRETVSGTEETAEAYRVAVAANSDRFADDLASGRLDPYLWSIFAAPMTEEAVLSARVEHEHKPSGTNIANDWNWCSFKNESFPTELVLSMNGLDEEYDKSHGWQDSEFSYRLREDGVFWQNAPAGKGLVSIVNPRPIMNIKNMPERLFYNRDLCFGERVAWKRLSVNPDWSLRDWRARVLGEMRGGKAALGT